MFRAIEEFFGGPRVLRPWPTGNHPRPPRPAVPQGAFELHVHTAYLRRLEAWSKACKYGLTQSEAERELDRREFTQAQADAIAQGLRTWG